MRTLITIAIIITSTITLLSQVHGNKIMTTQSQSVEGLENIDIQLNANIILDYNLEETLTITTDENVIELIGIEFKNGKLTLDQKERIQPSKLPIITIGSPNLKKVYQGTHSETTIQNITGEKLSLHGNVGTIVASGSIENLDINSDGVSIDLRNVVIKNAEVIVEGSARIITDKVVNLKTTMDEDADLVLLSEPKKYSGNDGRKADRNTQLKTANPDLRYIQFKIKNNSWKRNHFVVKGPKRDGGTFSYGFPMMPKSSRSENWTIGTKIYKEKRMGPDELLVTITAKDEGTVVDLFQD